MKVGYGFCRTEKALRDAGAERVWIDVSRERTERADMVRLGGIRSGDVLVLLAENDLGGNSRANKKWRKMLEDMGVSIEVYDAPKPAPKLAGRPTRLKPDDEQLRQIRDLWIDPTRTKAYVVRRASEIMGHVVTYAQLYYLFETKKQD